MASGVNRPEKEPGGQATGQSREEREVEGGVWKIGTVQVCSVFVFKGLRHGREHGALTGARIQGYKGLDLGYGRKLMYIVAHSGL